MITLRKLIIENIGDNVATEKYFSESGYDQNDLDSEISLVYEIKSKSESDIYTIDGLSGFHISTPTCEFYFDGTELEAIQECCIGDKWEVAQYYALGDKYRLQEAFKDHDNLPKSALYDACIHSDNSDFLEELLKDVEHHFKFDEFSERSGYYIFDDNSLYGYNGGDAEVWADYKDFVEDMILPLLIDDYELQSADQELLNLYNQ